MFITFEGVEGSGKSTIAKMIYEYLLNRKYDVVLTREPGGVKIAEDIRNIILNKDNKELDNRAEALLFAASRRQHLVEKVIPALKEGKIVLCDRFLDSSLAYQGGGKQLGVKEILKVNEFAVDGLFPDLTIIFDVDPAFGLERIARNRNREVNRLDLESLPFYDRVRKTFLDLAKKDKNRYVVLDGSGDAYSVFKETIKVILERIK